MPTKPKTPRHLEREFVERRTHAPDDEPPPSPEELRKLLDWRVIRVDAEGGDL